ncbi:hypothetical protein KSP40_PGU022813 [Platanthera guangdongensis]|uniref:Uncharacterized protein n=1 Tax=Platanthera guangdongensis TaxID=2320717 RepID=A0ABR2M176_9ASPA
MHRRTKGHAIRQVIMNHQGNRQKPASTFYLINASLPKVGDLVHVASTQVMYKTRVEETYITRLGSYSPTVGHGTNERLRRRIFSVDSDLEAFSHNPTHGSFAPLAFQPSAMTNCVNQRFLSY